jgi:hypothetical protein
MRLLLISLILLGCNPVKKVLNDKSKFDIVAEEVIRRGYCVNDTTVIEKVRDSIVYKDSIIEIDVPCKDFDTTIGRARIKVVNGVMTYTAKDSVVYRTKTVTNTVKDRSLENILKGDIQKRDSLINVRDASVLSLRTANKELKSELGGWKLKFWGLIVAALVVIFRKQIAGLLWRFLK